MDNHPHAINGLAHVLSDLQQVYFQAQRSEIQQLGENNRGKSRRKGRRDELVICASS